MMLAFPVPIQGEWVLTVVLALKNITAVSFNKNKTISCWHLIRPKPSSACFCPHLGGADIVDTLIGSHGPS